MNTYKLPLAMLLGLFASTAAFANTSAQAKAWNAFQQTLKEYETVGRDNNSIYQIRLTPKQFRQLDSNSIWTIYGQKDLEHTLKECVFMVAGAYGRHVTIAQQAQLATKARLALEKLQGVRFAQIGQIHSDIIDAPCALAIIGDNSITAVQGYSVD